MSIEKKSVSVLLADPHSVFHGPPVDIKSQDQNISALYSAVLNKAIDRRTLQKSASKNWNAISTKYVSNYGLLMLGGELKSRGYDVMYINGDYFESESSYLAYILALADCVSAICFTATTPQYPHAKKIANAIKETHPDVKCFIGGPHTYFFRRMFEENPFDLVLVGHNLCQSIDAIESCLTGHVGGQIIQTEGYVDYKKDFSLIPAEKLHETLLYSYASFGCPNSCRYCVEHNFAKSVYYHSVVEKVDEVAYLVKNLGVRSVHLADSDFFLNPYYTNLFLDELEKRNLSACYTVNTSPYTLSRADARKAIYRFADLGLIELLIGIEYFSNDVLLTMGKQYSIEKLMRALEKVKWHCPDIIVSFYSLVGFPGESKKTIDENCGWFKSFFSRKLVDFSFPKIMVPYPGTGIFEHPEKFGVEILHQRWEEYHRWSLPRPVRIEGQTEEMLMDELKALYQICGFSVSSYLVNHGQG